MKDSGAALVLFATVLAAACGRVRYDESLASDCGDPHCPAQGVAGGAKTTNTGGAVNGGASSPSGGANTAGEVEGVAGEGGTDSNGDDAGDAGSAGAPLTYSGPHWGTEQSVSRGQNAAMSVDSEQSVAVAGDDSAFTIWTSSDSPGWSVYASRYTPDSGWSDPYLLDEKSGGYGSALIATEHDGDAIAVWLRYTDAGSEVRAARYHGGWQASVPIKAPSSDLIGEMTMVSNSNGDYFVAWPEYADAFRSGRTQIVRYDHDTGWQPPFAPSCAPEADANVGSGSVHVSASINPEGDALFSWLDTNADGTNDYVIAQRYVAGGGFATCETPSGLLPGSLSGGQALDDAGHGLLTWQQGRANGKVQASTFKDSWSAPVDLDSGGASELAPGGPLAASDGAGHFVVVWTAEQSDLSVYGASSLLGAEWSAPMALDSTFDVSPQRSYVPVISMSHSGTALIGWERESGVGNQPQSLAATSFRYESGFAPSTALGNDEVVGNLSIVSDPQGNGMLLWHSGNGALGPSTMQAVRYTTLAGWQQRVGIMLPGQDGDRPTMAVGESGEVVAVWYSAYPYLVAANVYR